MNNDMEIKFNTKEMSIDYKLLEWRLVLNRELYEDKVIDLKIYSMVEKSILGRMTKIVNDTKERIKKEGNNFEY